MLTMDTLDPLDARILLALDDDPEATTLAVARSLGIARNTVHARLRRMTDSGALRTFSRRVDPVAMGYELAAFISIAISQASGGQAVLGLQAVPEVVEIHAMTGEYDFLVKVVARDTPDLLRITNRMLTIDGVVRTNTAISLVEAMPMRIRPLLESAAGPS